MTHVRHSATLYVSPSTNSSARGALPPSDFGAENVWVQGNAEQTPQPLMLELPVQQQLERQLRLLEHMELQSSRTSIPPDGRNPPKSAEFSQHVHVQHMEQDTEHLMMRPQHPIMQATQQLMMPAQQMEQLMVPASVQVRAPPVPQEPPQPDQFQHNPFEVSPSEEQQQQQLQEAVQCEMQQLIQQQRQQQQALIEQQERDRISMLTMKQQQVSYTPTQNNARHVDARTNASAWNTCMHVLGMHTLRIQMLGRISH